MRAPPILFSAWCLIATAFADEAAAPSKSAVNILAECQMVVVPEKLAMPLLQKLLEDATIEAGFAEIQKMIENGRAELAANLMARMSDPLTVVTESVEEFSYGTQFDPPALPQNAPQDANVLKSWPLIAITPTQFDKRNVGATMSISADWNDGSTSLEVAADCTHVRFLRWAKTDAGKLATGEVLSVQQPVFHSMKSHATILFRNGQRVLLGVHKVPGAVASLEFFFLRVTATPSRAK